MTYDTSDIIVDDAPLHFTSVGAIIGNWNAYAMDENGNYVELDKLNYATNEYDFDPSAIVWNNIERTFEDSINSWIFKVKISFLRTQNVKEDIFVNISLLPSKPVITDIDFQYEYDWINDYMSFDSEFLFNVQSDRVDDYWLYCSDSNNFKDESEPFSGIYGLLNLRNLVKHIIVWQIGAKIYVYWREISMVRFVVIQFLPLIIFMTQMC